MSQTKKYSCDTKITAASALTSTATTAATAVMGPVAPHVGKRSHISWKTHSQMTPHLVFIGNTV